MSKEEENKVTIDQLYQEQVDAGNIEVSEFNCELLRSDGLRRVSKACLWIEWDDTGRFKERHDQPAIGRSLIMSPFNHFFTWQTSKITELIEVSDTVVKFKTQNSDYELKFGPVEVNGH